MEKTFQEQMDFYKESLNFWAESLTFWIKEGNKEKEENARKEVIRCSLRLTAKNINELFQIILGGK